jgi:hypothetical protein
MEDFLFSNKKKSIIILVNTLVIKGGTDEAQKNDQ